MGMNDADFHLGWLISFKAEVGEGNHLLVFYSVVYFLIQIFESLFNSNH